MDLKLTEELVSKAQECYYARCSATTRIIVGHLLALSISCLVVILVIGIARNELGVQDFVIDVPLIILGGWWLAQIVFRDALSKRAVKKLFDLTDAIDMEVNWSEDAVEIKYGRTSKKLKWEDFKGWLETNGLLLLYRRRKFFDMSDCRVFDAIDMSQVSEEEIALFREILTTKVKPIA
jgi:hypothetical protein